MAQFVKDARLLYGSLPATMLLRSKLSPMARLCWGVCDSFGIETNNPDRTLANVAIRMGLSPKSKNTVLNCYSELYLGGFLKIVSGQTLRRASVLELTMPEYCFMTSPDLLDLATDKRQAPAGPVWSPGASKGRRLYGRKARKGIGGKKRLLPVDGSAAAASQGPYVSADTHTQAAASQGPYVSADTQTISQLTDTYVSPDRTINNLTATGEGSDQQSVATGISFNLPPTVSPFKIKITKEGSGLATDKITPLGWERYAEKFQKKQGRRFAWTKKERAAALAVSQALAAGHSDGLLDLIELEKVQDNFLNCKYWGVAGKRMNPLDKLEKFLSEYLPMLPPAPVVQRIQQPKSVEELEKLSQEATQWEQLRKQGKSVAEASAMVYGSTPTRTTTPES